MVAYVPLKERDMCPLRYPAPFPTQAILNARRRPYLPISQEKM
jgi:hypothetical protein